MLKYIYTFCFAILFSFSYNSQAQAPSDPGVIVSAMSGIDTIFNDGDTLQMVYTMDPDTFSGETVSWSITPITGQAVIDPMTGIVTGVLNGTVSAVATITHNGETYQGSSIVTILNQLPFFTLSPVGDTARAICGTNSTQFEMEVDVKATAQGNITFVANNLPVGANATFSPSTLNADGNVQIQITNANNTASNTLFSIIATNDFSNSVDSQQFNLEITTNSPSITFLTSPANNAVLQPQIISLDWNDAFFASSYEIQIDTNTSFANPVYTGTSGISEHQAFFNATYNKEHYWRVRAINVCGNGTWSDTWKYTTQPTAGVVGCKDSNALNYNPAAIFNDGSCTYPYHGCLDASALNYNANANTDDGSCIYNGVGIIATKVGPFTYTFQATGNVGAFSYVYWNFGDGSAIQYGNPITHNFTSNGNYLVNGFANVANAATYNPFVSISINAWGCTDQTAFNYHPQAAIDDGSCQPIVLGCIDTSALNYNANANTNDGTCIPKVFGCMNDTMFNYNPNANVDDGSCIEKVYGCIDTSALNFDANANTDNGTCIPKVLGCMDSTAFNYNANANVDDGSCVAIVNGCTNPLASNYMNNANTDDGSCVFTQPTDSIWSVVNTPDNHTILIQNMVDVSDLSVGLDSGDYIGVFYTKGAQLQCGGKSIWNGSNSAITAFKKLANIDNGFEENENFVWKLWKASTNLTYDLNTVYNASQPNQGVFETDGISEAIKFENGSTHTLDLVTGWNFVSTNVIPDNDSIHQVLQSIENRVFLVKDENGSVYWPSAGVNNINKWNIAEAYKINMTADTSLLITGTSILPEQHTITLNQGWSYIGYPRKNNANIANVLSGISNNIFLVKNGAGAVYWPSFNINNIGNMNVGAGYQIRMLEDTTFTFPANSTPILSAKKQQPKTANFYHGVAKSQRNMHIMIPENTWQNKPELHAEIGVFVGDKLVGAGVYQNTHLPITIFGDEAKSIDGKDLTFKINSGGKEQNLNLEFNNFQQKSTFIENEILIVKKAKLTNSVQVLEPIQIDFIKETIIISQENSDLVSYQVRITDNLGRLIIQEQFETEEVNIKLDDLKIGTYFVEIKTNSYSSTEKIVIKE